MTLIELIKKHTSSQAFEIEAQQIKRDEQTFYQADEEGNTAFHHLVLAMDSGLSQYDAVLILCYLMGTEKVVENGKIDINAIGGQQLTALQLAVQKNRNDFASLMVHFDKVCIDQSNVRYFKDPVSGFKKLAIQSALLFKPSVVHFSAGVEAQENIPSLPLTAAFTK